MYNRKFKAFLKSSKINHFIIEKMILMTIRSKDYNEILQQKCVTTVAKPKRKTEDIFIRPNKTFCSIVKPHENQETKFVNLSIYTYIEEEAILFHFMCGPLPLYQLIRI